MYMQAYLTGSLPAGIKTAREETTWQKNSGF